MMNYLSKTHQRSFFLIAGLLLSGIPVVAAAADYETARTLKSSDFLSAAQMKGTYHSVAPEVFNDGYQNLYTVKSSFGPFNVTSKTSLNVLLIELQAIDKMKKIEGSAAYASALKTAASSTVAGVKNLVTHPIDTIGSAVSGVGKLFQGVGESLFGSSDSDAEDSKMKAIIGFSKTKRRVAGEFGVDPYSRNKVLQKELEKMAWVEFAGEMTLAIPSAGAGAGLKVANYSRALKDLVIESPPSVLRSTNRAKLLAMGISDVVTDLFIGNKVFSPSEQTYLIGALESITGAKNRETFIKFSILTTEPDVAKFRQRQAEMYLDYHLNQTALVKFVSVANIAIAISAKGDVIVATPLDHLLWTREIAAIVSRLDFGIYKLKGVKSKQLWLSGSVSSEAHKALRKLGWSVHVLES